MKRYRFVAADDARFEKGRAAQVWIEGKLAGMFGELAHDLSKGWRTTHKIYVAQLDIDPILAAAMLPCICGVMCGITPPLGLGMYAGMSLAESDFDKTFKNNMFWVAGQFAMQVIVLMGWLPILGL